MKLNSAADIDPTILLFEYNEHYVTQEKVNIVQLSK